jgi:rubrerythrin
MKTEQLELLEEVQIVHCLMCEHTFVETVPMIKECPKCGNKDTKQTHYLEVEK